MTNKVTVLLKAYVELSSNEQDELKQLIKEHDGKGYFEKGEQQRSLNESTKRIMGPTSGFGCPVCGK